MGREWGAHGARMGRAWAPEGALSVCVYVRVRTHRRREREREREILRYRHKYTHRGRRCRSLYVVWACVCACVRGGGTHTHLDLLREPPHHVCTRSRQLLPLGSPQRRDARQHGAERGDCKLASLWVLGGGFLVACNVQIGCMVQGTGSRCATARCGTRGLPAGLPVHAVLLWRGACVCVCVCGGLPHMVVDCTVCQTPLNPYVCTRHAYARQHGAERGDRQLAALWVLR
jgi:hypothetical protein